MSHSQLQEALAMLIRLPEHNRTTIDAFIAGYQLSPQDKLNLQQLASNREVNKFAYKMRRGRINFLVESIPLTLEFLDPDKFIKFVENEFDPKYTNVHARQIYREFRQFISQFGNEKPDIIKEYLGDLPDFLLDLMIFELLDSELEFQGFKNTILADNARLKHNRFEILSLDYKIHHFVERKRIKSAKENASTAPKKGKTFLLFLFDENEFGYQLFEIDNVGMNFLEQARNGIEVQAPSYYNDFIECGLCN